MTYIQFEVETNCEVNVLIEYNFINPLCHLSCLVLYR